MSNEEGRDVIVDDNMDFDDLEHVIHENISFRARQL
jgi:hypothetical protein